MQKSLPEKKTKIVCTIGPASNSPAMLEAMIRNGMDVARLNFAHGTPEGHRQIVERVRAAAAAVGKRVAIMGDLPGPKMRIGQLSQEPVDLEQGQRFTLQSEEIVGDEDRVSLSFDGLAGAAKKGDKIFVNDGFILLEVDEIIEDDVHCQVQVGGELRSFKGVNLPGIDLGIESFTAQDMRHLRLAAELGIDAVSQSFVQSDQDLNAMRQAAADLNFYPFIIAKIERARAVENLEAILEATDGLMVARGDLGVEIPIEEIAIVQKQIIRRANIAGKPVITATQMLQSMTENLRPTRAEATDVANAIADGTDCVMLSEETATGKYPDHVVGVMARIAAITEPHCEPLDAQTAINTARSMHETSAERRIALSIYLSSEAIAPVAVITPTYDGMTPRQISRFRLPMWIVAFSPNEQSLQQLKFSWGVYPVHLAELPSNWTGYVREWLYQHGVDNGLALLTYGIVVDEVDQTNQIMFIDLQAGG